jgi:molecular chaperone GrpE
MTKRHKPETEPRLRVDDLDNEIGNLYKKQWPTDEEATSDLANEEDAESEVIAGILDHPSYKELEQKLTEAENKATDFWNQQLRAQAELDNMRRRSERDVSNAHKYALEKFVADLLPVIDSLDRALLSDTNQNQLAEKIHEGIELTMSIFLKAMAKYGVKRIDPIDQQFNPEQHQAISTVSQEGVTSNTVVEVLQMGYALNDRLIRPALVVVAM